MRGSNQTNDLKLQALFKTLEAHREELLSEFKRISQIAESRRVDLDRATALVNQLDGEMENLKKNTRTRGLLGGNANLAAGSSFFAKRVKKKLDRAKQQHAEVERDFVSSEKRQELARSELQDVQVEIKKLEKMLERKEMVSQGISLAIEEFEQDELSMSGKSLATQKSSRDKKGV